MMQNYRYSHLLLFQTTAPLVRVSESYVLRLPREFAFLMKQLLYVKRVSRKFVRNAPTEMEIKFLVFMLKDYPMVK